MKINNKGMTLVEIIVSITLISIVLIFLMNLFIRVRDIYNQSKINAEYDMLVSSIIKSIGDDMETYGLRNVEYIGDDSDTLLFTYNTFRPSKLSERIKKVLKVSFNYTTNKYVISYSYVACDNNEEPENTWCTPYITNAEHATSQIRTVPEGDEVIMDSSKYIEFNGDDDIAKIKIPISSPKGNIYDINIYGVMDKSE